MNNPFANFDYKKYFDAFQSSGFDAAGLFQTQQKNIEMLISANRIASECAQAIARKQAELFQQSLEQASSAFQQAISNNGKAPDVANFPKQAEYAQALMEKGVKNARDISEMVATTNREVLSLMNKRFNESVAETQQVISKAAQRKPAAAG